MKQKSTENLEREIRQLKRDIIFLKRDKLQLTREIKQIKSQSLSLEEELEDTINKNTEVNYRQFKKK